MPPKRAPQLPVEEKKRRLDKLEDSSKRIVAELELKLATHTAIRIALSILACITRRKELPARMGAVPVASDSVDIPRLNARKRLRPSGVDEPEHNNNSNNSIRPVVPTGVASVSARPEIIPPSEMRVYEAFLDARPSPRPQEHPRIIPGGGVSGCKP